MTFDELLGFLVQENAVSSSQAQHLFEAQERQRATLARQTGKDEASSLTPIDLFLSFKLKGPGGEELSEDAVTEIYARKIGLEYVKLDPLKLDGDFITSAFSRAFARNHTLLALEDAGAAIRAATYNPFDWRAIESVERASGKTLELVIASKSDIQRLITEFYGFRKSVKSAEEKLSQGVDLGNLEQFVRMKSEREIESSDEHVIHAVEYLFSYAFQQRASDIHIEPKREESIVRFRIDGALHEVQRMPKVVHAAVVNRIKTLARLDIGEKRRPQDGRIKTAFDDKKVEIRVSTLAVAFGEKIVLRVFDPEIVGDDLKGLGFFERELEIFERLIDQPNGIVLVTGPTGSGKTTTLYTALRRLATDAVNITTIEDPIEMVFERVNQTAINPSIGLGFGESLRTLLRQDPDIVMVGEIRDLDTARHAIQASLTGHLVFSTLHTNDAPSAITRLMDLGAENFLLASTLSGVVAQRLVKKICQYCRDERTLSSEERDTLLGTGAAESAITLPDVITCAFGAGCVECRQSGYRGRSAIYEMFEVNDVITKLIMRKADATEVKRQARRDGMLTLREAAVKKMLEGATSFEEVIGVTRVDRAAGERVQDSQFPFRVLS